MSDVHQRQDVGVLALVNHAHPVASPRGPGELDEEAKMRARATPERLASYRLGRAAARVALDRWLGTSPEMAADVVRGPLGQPRATRLGADVAEMSISHCPGWAAAVAAECGRPVAVDIEPRESDRVASVGGVLPADELRRAQACGLGPADAGLVLWTAREAAAKALRTGLTVSTEVLDVGEITLESRHVVGVRYERLRAMAGRVMLFDECVVALATPAYRRTRLVTVEASNPCRTSARQWTVSTVGPRW